MSFAAQLGGARVEVVVEADALRAGPVSIAYADMDDVIVDGWSVTLRGPTGEVTLDGFGRSRDDFLRELRTARLPARRAALLQSGASEVLDEFAAAMDGGPVLVGIHVDGLTVEPDAGAPAYVPLSCVTAVQRDGYDVVIRAQSIPHLTLRKMGRRTDEFVGDLEAARRDLAARTAAAYGEVHPSLTGLRAPDGWAVTKPQAGAAWSALRAVVEQSERGDEIRVLEEFAGDSLRLGLKTSFAGGCIPFALAPCNGNVAVESAGDEARATFVFRTGDVDHLNLVLLLTSFRREALFLPEDQLGRWAAAVRLLENVRWARSSLAARVVHDARWEERVRTELARDPASA